MWARVRRTATQAGRRDVALAADAYFVGRLRVLTEVVAWLTSPPTDAPELLAITGSPGSGKSAVIQRLALMANPATRELTVDQLSPLPEVPTFDLVVNARSLTRTELASTIRQAASVPAHGYDLASDRDVMHVLLQRDRAFILVVDAVDEAVQPEEIARLLIDLATGAPSQIRILIATRRHLTRAFSFAHVIDLDTHGYEDRVDVAYYVRHRLSSPESPLADQPSAVAKIAEQIASNSNGNFLYAKLICDLINEDERLLDRLVRGEMPPYDLSQVFEELLAGLGTHEKDAIVFLSALARGSAEGLTAEDWVAAASERQHRSYDLADLDRFVLRTSLRNVLTTDGPMNHRRYRFFHVSTRYYFAEGFSGDLPL